MNTANRNATQRVASPIEIGHVSEKAFDLEATKRGWLVAANTGNGTDFDYIIKRPHLARPVVIQVKKAKFAPGGTGSSSYLIKTARRHWTRGTIGYSPSAFDVLAAHLPDVNKWVFYTRAELGNRLATTYLLPEQRRIKTKRSAPDARDPNNWELLDDVAESLTLSGPTPADA